MADEKPFSTVEHAHEEVSLPVEIRKAIRHLPSEEREKVEVFIRTSAFRGPFPPPWMLEEYERHYTGFLADLMARAKQAQDHQEQMDNKSVEAQLSYMNRGQWLGYSVVVGALSAATYCATIGQWQVGVTLGLSGLAPIIGHFLKNPFEEKSTGSSTAPPAPTPPETTRKDRRRNRP